MAASLAFDTASAVIVGTWSFTSPSALRLVRLAVPYAVMVAMVVTGVLVPGTHKV